MKLGHISKTPKQRMAMLLVGSVFLTAVGHFSHQRILYDRHRREAKEAKEANK